MSHNLYSLRRILAAAVLTVVAVGLLALPAVAAGEATASVSGRVFVDGNNNLAFDLGEQPLTDIDLVVVKGGADDEVGTSDDTTVQAKSDATGTFTVTGLPPGAYRITATQPQSALAGLNPEEGVSVDVDLPAGVVAYATYLPFYGTATNQPGADGDIDAGAEAGTVRGLVYQDINDNGARDVGEPGIPGVIVSQVDGSKTAKSDASGTFEFTDMPMGPNRLSVDPADPAAAGRTLVTDAEVTAVVGEATSRPAFGFRHGSAEGRAFIDVDGNGEFSDGDQAVPKVSLSMKPLADGGDEPPSDGGDKAMSDASGKWRLSGLPVGSHTLLVKPPKGYEAVTKEIALGQVAGDHLSSLNVIVRPLNGQVPPAASGSAESTTNVSLKASKNSPGALANTGADLYTMLPTALAFIVLGSLMLIAPRWVDRRAARVS